MIFEVIRKEILSNITTPKVVITYIVCSVLILSALLTGALNYISSREEIVMQNAAERDRLGSIYNFQQDFLQRGVAVYREPDVLSVLVSGVEGDAPRQATLTAMMKPTYSISRFNSTPILAVFGLLDLSFIVKIILSLFAILFTFDAISGEKELGTLKLNLATSMKRSSFIIGKFIGLFILLILPFIIPLLIGLLVVSMVPEISFGGEEWARIALIVLAYILYLMVFYSMGIMISAFSKRSSVAFLVSLMVWVLAIAIIPRVAVLTAQTIAPVPSVEEVRLNIIKIYSNRSREMYDEMFSKQADLQRDVMQRKPRPPIVNSPQAQADFEKRNQDWQAYVQKVQADFQTEVQEMISDMMTDLQEISAEIFREVHLQEEEQNWWATTISRFTSPSAAVTFACDRLARTGVYSSDEVFKNNMDKLSQPFADANAKLLKENPSYLGFGSTQTQAIDVSKYYPDISLIRKESLAESVTGTIFDYAMLILLSIIFMATAFVAFLRYDAR